MPAAPRPGSPLGRAGRRLASGKSPRIGRRHLWQQRHRLCSDVLPRFVIGRRTLSRCLSTYAGFARIGAALPQRHVT